MLIALISCVKSKRPVRSHAIDLYTSSLFKKSVAFARQRAVDRIYILSAKHGLLSSEDEVDPYEQTLKGAAVAVRRTWAKQVVADLEKVANLKDDRFLILAGESYCQFIRPSIQHCEEPLRGLKQGFRLQKLNQMLEVR